MRRRELPGGIPPPTKTGLKRQAMAVQDLADRLIGAPEALVASLGLPAKLADAVALAHRITSRAALARQRQFVAKLMRGLELEPIRVALEAAAQSARVEAARFRRAERWRDRLVAEGEAAAAEFAVAFPDADRARLARLVAESAGERNGARAASARRELFRWIRRVLESA